jgi:large subunit ribosomal protein L1
MGEKQFIMATKQTKKRKAVEEKYDKHKVYSLEEATKLVKEVKVESFDASVDLAVCLGVDPTQADQNVRGTVTLPHGTGKEVEVLALCKGSQQKEAEKAGADHVGLEEYIEKIKNGWTDIDAVVATPDVMPQIGKLGKVLGPRGLMPNPKSGTVAKDIGEVVEEIKKGKLSFRVDKNGVIHLPVGRTSFKPKQLYDNVWEILQTISHLRPASAKGDYFRSIHLSTTMSPSVKVETKSLNAI